MKRWAWLWFVLAVVVVMAGYSGEVQAGLVHYTFGGSVAYVSSDGPLNTPAIAAGDRFTGSFSYDSSSPLAPGTPAPPTFLSPGQITLQLRGWAFHSDPNHPLYLSLNTPLEPPGGFFSVTGLVPDPGLISPSPMPGFLGLLFFNDPARPLLNTPPARLNLSAANGAALALTYPSQTAGDFALPSFNLGGTIDELAPDVPINAPEPGTLALSLLGVLTGAGHVTVRALRAAACAKPTRDR